MIYSCIDIGGTAIKFGLVDETGRFHKKGSLPTEAATGGGPGIVHKVRSLIQRQLADHPLAGIGISTAGIIDTERGAVDYALSIPDYTRTAWKSLLENEFQLPCIVENDTNCAALGEWWLGAGRDMDSLFAVTVRPGKGRRPYLLCLGPSGRCHGSSCPRYILPESGRWPGQYRLPVQSRWHRPRRRHHGPRGYPAAEAGSCPGGAIAGHDAAA